MDRSASSRTVALGPLWDRIWVRRRQIVTLVMTASVVMAVITFFLAPWYKAEAELLPPSEDEGGVGLTSMLKGLAVPGVRIPMQVAPADVFMIVLESRRVNEKIVERFDLKRLYKQKLMVDAVRELRRHASFKLTQAGSIRISVEDRDRQRAADMANAYADYLDEFNRQSRMTKGRRTRLFIEGRLAETKQELAVTERRLAEYQAKNKTVALTPEMSSAVEQAATLYGRRTALVVRLGVVRGFSEGSEEEIQIQQELAQIDRQLGQLPVTGLELVRLVRDVKALEQVFAILTAQYEDARITEARDVVTVELLDRAKPPEKKSRPHRTLMVAAAFLASLLVGVGMAVLKSEERAAPALRAVAAD